MPALQVLLPLLLIGGPSAALGPAPATLDERQLAAALWRSAPEVLAARRASIDATAERDRAHLLPNPAATASWGSVPLGKPVGDGGFFGTQYYQIGVGQFFEIGKRGPRQQAAEAGRVSSATIVREVWREAYFELLGTLADQANAAARAGVLERLVATGTDTLRLQRARAEHGDVAALDVDRLEVDHLRLMSSLDDARADQAGALAPCSRLLGGPCPSFSGEQDAVAFIDAFVKVTLDGTDDDAAVEARPDLQALRAERKRLEAEVILAERRTLPDPTVSLAYTQDRLPGNQPSSLLFSVSVPLPVFDRGQVDAARARAQIAAVDQAIAALRAGAKSAVAATRRQLAHLAQRARTLDERAVPEAQRVAAATEAAARQGGVSLQDVLLARRALLELELDRAGVATSRFRAALDLRRALGAMPPGDEPRS